MTGQSSFVAPGEPDGGGADAPGRPAPLDVRDPEVVRALAEAVAILGPDSQPRLMLGRLGAYVDARGLENMRRGVVDWVHRDDHRLLVDALARSRRAPGADVDVRVRVQNEHDGWHDMTLVFRNLLDHPDVQGTLVRTIDQTLSDREARWRTLVGASPIGIFEVDVEDRCTFVNPAFERLTGIAAQDALGHGWTAVFPAGEVAEVRRRQTACGETTEGGETTGSGAAAGGGETAGEALSCELRLTLADGSYRWVTMRSVPLHESLDGRVTGFLRTLEDVTERKRLEERLEHDATHDRLTGLGSRALLVEELTSALGRLRRGGPDVALLFIDLDGFKHVNDLLGHAAGDELLVQVAKRLRGAVRASDACVRLGGDEFVVCCRGEEGADRDGTGDAGASQLAARLLDALNAPYDVHGHEVVVGASIGIAAASRDDPVSIDQLLSNADVAAYRAKRMGRGRVEVFDVGLRRQLAKARRIGRTLGRLLREPRLPIRCSPIADLHSGEVVGFDCAVDWDAAGIGEDPATVARVVDDDGMSRDLDIAIVRTMLAHLSDWELRPPGPIVPGLSVTLTRSGALSPLLPEVVREMLERSGVAPARCWFGIPEAAVARDLDTASRVASALDALGAGVALRDFGSAISSLEQLRRLPAPTTTIAGPLVAAVAGTAADDDAAGTLLAAVVRYAVALGRIVVAFDVQDAEHARRLRELGCSHGSGPAFGPRLRPGEIPDFLAERGVR